MDSPTKVELLSHRMVSDGRFTRRVEEILRFPEFTIPEIKKAFAHTAGKDVLNQEDIQEFLKNLGISEEEAKNSDIFGKFFKSFDYDEGQYDKSQLMTSLFLLSKSSKYEKAIALFEVYDLEDAGKMPLSAIGSCIHRMCECVFDYTLNVCRVTEEKPELLESYKEKFTHKLDELIAKIVSETPNNENIEVEMTKEEFYQFVNRADLGNIIDLTSTTSIRSVLLDFIKPEGMHGHESSRKKRFVTQATLSRKNSLDETTDTSSVYGLPLSRKNSGSKIILE